MSDKKKATQFKKGVSPNPGGRPKNANGSFRVNVRKMFADRDFNPIRNMMDISDRALASGDDELFFSCNKELAQYYIPKLRSVEIVAEQANPLNFVVNIAKNKDIVNG